MNPASQSTTDAINLAPARDAAPVIAIDGLTFAYDRNSPVLTDVNLAIHPLEFVCIVGPNGGGKTTLLKLILGLIEPARGRIRIFDRPPETARRRIGYMPQYARLDPLFPVTVMDVVLMGRLGNGRSWGFATRADRDHAAAALTEVDLLPQCHRSFAALSGGQKQRALIARAIASEPELLLLDEPTSNLDIAAQSDFYELLHRMNEKRTLVLVSHDIAYVSKFVDKVICVNRSVAVHGTGEISDEHMRELYGREMRVVVHDHAYQSANPGNVHIGCDHDHGPPPAPPPSPNG
jgi:zinc transport system ATP-binding protein